MLKNLFIVMVLFNVSYGSNLARGADLTQDDLDNISKIENYLNSITSLKSIFLQTASTGERSGGVLFLDRPGKMRVQYDEPSPILLVSDGSYVIYVEKNLEQISHFPIRQTPLRVLIEKDVDLQAWYEIKDIKSGPGTLRLTLTMKDDLSLGSIQLLFSDRPMQLRQWTIRDQQGIEVRVSLMDMQRGARLNPKLFEVDPNLFSSSNREN